MQERFDKFFHQLSSMKGGYKDRVYPSGEETIFGVSQTLAKKCGYDKDIVELELCDLKAIYKKLYWEEWMEDFPEESLSFYLFEMNVHHGKKETRSILKLALGHLGIKIRTPKDFISLLHDLDPQIALYSLVLHRMQYFIHIGLKDVSKVSQMKKWTTRVLRNLR